MSLKTHSVTKTKRTMLESGSFFFFKLNISLELPINNMLNNTKEIVKLKKVFSLVTIVLLAVTTMFSIHTSRAKAVEAAPLYSL